VSATTVSASPKSTSATPVRRITSADADAALREGWADFMDMRGDLIFVGLIYVLVGVVAATAVMYERPPGPFVRGRAGGVNAN